MQEYLIRFFDGTVKFFDLYTDRNLVDQLLEIEENSGIVVFAEAVA